MKHEEVWSTIWYKHLISWYNRKRVLFEVECITSSNLCCQAQLACVLPSNLLVSHSSSTQTDRCFLTNDNWSYKAVPSVVLVSFAGNETLRCLALALKRMPLGQQALSFDDEKDLTFIGLVCYLFYIAHFFFCESCISNNLICLIVVLFINARYSSLIFVTCGLMWVVNL